MTRPMTTPLTGFLNHFRSHSHAYGDASIVLGTVLFLIVGTLIALTMLPHLP